MSLVANLARNSMRAGWAKVMVNKVLLRLKERSHAKDRTVVEEWCRANETDIASWARRLDTPLWEEATAFATRQREHARLKLQGLDLGGGGAYDLLYFLTRFTKPEVIVETGVAAGFSSRAFLTALKVNGGGRLLSSDFPYFRMADPENYVGYIVEEDLRKEWNLRTAGDQTNLPAIHAETEKIDLFHYDSDKSFGGRRFALELLKDRFHATTLIVFDDIQDNAHFIDMVAASGKPFAVFGFEGKWLGMTGGPNEFYNS